MQTRQPDRKVTPKAPRRARRGALMPAALLVVLVITLLLSQFASAQLRQARDARVEARAVQLAAIAADFDYYVHDRREDIAQEMCSTQPGLGGNSDFHTITVDPAEFEPNYLRSGVTPRIPGFTLQYIADCRRHGHDILGILELIPENAMAEADMTTILARLSRHGVEERGVISTLRDDSSSRYIWTAPLSGVNPAYVLREPRAGHPPPRLVGAGKLDLRGCTQDAAPRNCDLVNLGSLIATGGAGSRAKRVVMAPAGAPDETTPLRAREMGGTLISVTGNVEIGGITRAETMTVDGDLTSGGLRLSASDDDDGGLTVGGSVLVSDWIKSDVLTTDMMTATRLTAQSTALTGAATVDDVLSADRLHSPDVMVRDDFNAGQVFTKEADIRDLEVRGACHGC